MNVNVTVSDLDLAAIVDETGDGVTLADKVAEAAIRQLANDGKVTDGDDWWSALSHRVRTIGDNEIRAQVAPLVATQIKAGIQRTNHFGEPVGEAKTLRDMILEKVEQQLRAPADPHGYDRRGETWVGKLVREEVEKALRTELLEAIKAEKERVVALVRAKAADIMARSLTEGIGR